MAMVPTGVGQLPIFSVKALLFDFAFAFALDFALAFGRFLFFDPKPTSSLSSLPKSESPSVPDSGSICVWV